MICFSIEKMLWFTIFIGTREQGAYHSSEDFCFNKFISSESGTISLCSDWHYAASTLRYLSEYNIVRRP